MLREIERDYKPTFYRPPPNSDKEFGPCFRWKAPKKGSLIVFHPDLPFDPWSADTRRVEIIARDRDRTRSFGGLGYSFNPFVPSGSERIMVLHETFRVKASMPSVIQSIIEAYPDWLRFAPRESYWWNTGFWSARLGEDNCIGISESAAEQYLESNRGSDFVYVLSNDSTIIELATEAGSRLTWVDVYLNNRTLPWVEMRRAVLSTLDHLGRWTSKGKDIGDKASVLERAGQRMNRQDGKQRRVATKLSPLAVAKFMPEVYQSAIAEWKFGTTPWPELDSMHYVLASVGPFLQDCEFTKSRFEIRRFFPYFLRSCILVDCCLQKTERMPRSRMMENILRQWTDL